MMSKKGNASRSLNNSFDHNSVASMNKSMSVNEVDPRAEYRLRMLNFSDCLINKVSYQKFILKNLSGIKTKFKFHSRKFEPLSHIAPSKKVADKVAAAAHGNTS
jgi:hypothetical protein